MPNHTQLSPAALSYLETALWSTVTDDGNPYDDEYGVEDFAPSALAEAQRVVTDFLLANRADLDAVGCDDERAAHDLWLTRNRHGAGFWDRGYPYDVGERLTDNAHAYGSTDIYKSEEGLCFGM